MLKNVAAIKPAFAYSREDDDRDSMPASAKNYALFLYDTAFGTFVGVH
jgi:hypothetical protein